MKRKTSMTVAVITIALMAVLAFLRALSVEAYRTDQVAGDGVSEAQRAGAGGTVKLSLDASEATKGIFHSRLSIPVSAGPVTLVYPEWLPGEHGPSGPAIELVGLVIEGNRQPIVWERDSVDMFSFHVEVPNGVSSLDVRLDYISPSTTIAGNGYGFSPNATAKLIDVLWNHSLVYPRGRNARDIMFQADLRLPKGWKFGTALPVTRERAESIEFETVSLETLVDSPLIAGEYFRVVQLGSPGGAPVEIDMVSDGMAGLDVAPDLVAGWQRLPVEANALFGAHHYRKYHFLVTLSDVVASNGLEHHESSDDRIPERTWIDAGLRATNATLLPHEYTHSWNGKFRRPAGLATPDYQEPMKGNLLWVYEGLTQYIGDVVLAGRTGLWTPDQVKENIASVAAGLEATRGRVWRPLEDTAVAAQLLYGAPDEWSNLRRGVDFYDEGLLIWLEADTIIRKQTSGAKSLDDFCHAFHGGASGPPEVKSYTFDDVVSALNSVTAYDWRQFFATRVQHVNPHAPMGGITSGGWKLAWSDVPNEAMANREHGTKVSDFGFSLGLKIKADGTITDVSPGSPAAAAGVAPGMKMVAVDGRRWNSDVMNDAVKATKSASGQLEIIAENKGYVASYRLDYHGGLRYPHLERVAGTEDLIGEIIKPRGK